MNFKKFVKDSENEQNLENSSKKEENINEHIETIEVSTPSDFLKELRKFIGRMMDNIFTGVTTEGGVANHTHSFEVDQDGNGKTSFDQKHEHKITEWVVEEANEHVHGIK